MRNTTKLKAILLKYSVTIDMPEEGLFVFTLTDKQNFNMHTIEGKSYSECMNKSLSHLKKNC
jgi:hypothetical protein